MGCARKRSGSAPPVWRRGLGEDEEEATASRVPLLARAKAEVAEEGPSIESPSVASVERRLSEELEAARAALRAETAKRRGAEARLQKEARRREAAEGEAAEQAEDIAEQACDHVQLESQVEQLDRSCSRLEGELVRTRAALAAAERRTAELERRVADGEQMARRPAALLVERERKNKQLSQQLDEKARLIASLREQLREAQSAVAAPPRPSASEDDAADGESCKVLLRQVAALRRGADEAEARCWQLEETLEEALREARSLANRLEQSEHHRGELAEGTREAELARARAEEECSKAVAAAGVAAAESPARRSCGAGSGDQGEQEVEEEPSPPSEPSREVREVLWEEAELAARRIEDLEARLRAAARRCGQLEVAGRKLLAEMDERGWHLERAEEEVFRKQLCIEELEAEVVEVRCKQSRIEKLEAEVGEAPHRGKTPCRARSANAARGQAPGTRLWASASSRLAMGELGPEGRLRTVGQPRDAVVERRPSASSQSSWRRSASAFGVGGDGARQLLAPSGAGGERSWGSGGRSWAATEDAAELVGTWHSSAFGRPPCSWSRGVAHSGGGSSGGVSCSSEADAAAELGRSAALGGGGSSSEAAAVAELDGRRGSGGGGGDEAVAAATVGCGWAAAQPGKDWWSRRRWMEDWSSDASGWSGSFGEGKEQRAWQEQAGWR